MTIHVIDGLGYYVEERGSGDPLVLLHGFTGSSENWHELMNALSRTFRVIAVDLPGHGRTEKTDDVTRYDMSRVASDLAQLLGVLGASPAHWLGYSMGGRLALYIAIYHHPVVCSLTLESASPGLKDTGERHERRLRDEALAETLETKGIEEFVDAWERLPLFSTQLNLPVDIREMVRRQRLTNSAKGLARSMQGMGTGSQPSLWAELKTIDRPVLLVTGALDTKFVAINQQMAADLPDGRLKIIAGSGHTVHLEQPTIFASIIGEFLALVSRNSRHDLPQTEQSDKDEGSNGQLLESRVETW